MRRSLLGSVPAVYIVAGVLFATGPPAAAQTYNWQGGGSDGFTIRRKAIDMNIPLITNRQLAEGFIVALEEMKNHTPKAKSWSEFSA